MIRELGCVNNHEKDQKQPSSHFCTGLGITKFFPVSIVKCSRETGDSGCSEVLGVPGAFEVLCIPVTLTGCRFYSMPSRYVVQKSDLKRMKS